jgi:hypothetical protein
MATRKFKMAKLKAHIQAICDLIDESDASMVDGKDKVLDLSGPDSDVKTPESEGAMDSRRGTQSMRTAFKNFDRLKKL